MRRIAVINQKGGVGKTTTSANLGAALALEGRRVVVIDMDAQANLSISLGVELASNAPSTYTVLMGESTIGEALRPSAIPNLSLVASNIDLSGAELELAGAIGREHLMRDALAQWVSEHKKAHGCAPADYVIFDCPPSLGLLSINALAAAGEVLITLQTEFLALQGMSKLVDVVQLLRRRLNPELVITGILPCLYDSRLKLAREVLGEIRSYFGAQVFPDPVRANVKLAEAPSFGKTIFEYAPESKGAEDYRRVAREVMKKEGRDPELAALSVREESRIATRGANDVAARATSDAAARGANGAAARAASDVIAHAASDVIAQGESDVVRRNERAVAAGAAVASSGKLAAKNEVAPALHVGPAATKRAVRAERNSAAKRTTPAARIVPPESVGSPARVVPAERVASPVRVAPAERTARTEHVAEAAGSAPVAVPKHAHAAESSGRAGRAEPGSLRRSSARAPAKSDPSKTAPLVAPEPSAAQPARPKSAAPKSSAPSPATTVRNETELSRDPANATKRTAARPIAGEKARGAKARAHADGEDPKVARGADATNAARGAERTHAARGAEPTNVARGAEPSHAARSVHPGNVARSADPASIAAPRDTRESLRRIVRAEDLPPLPPDAFEILTSYVRDE